MVAVSTRPKAIDEKFPERPGKESCRYSGKFATACRSVPTKSGKSRWNEIAMDKTFAHPNEFFQELPTCAALGQSLRMALTWHRHDQSGKGADHVLQLLASRLGAGKIFGVSHTYA